MNNIYDRLKALLEKIGIEANENSEAESAELNAIAAALEELESRLSEDEETLFSPESEGYIKKRCELMSLNPSWFGEAALAEKIEYLYSAQKGVFDLEEFNRDLERINIAGTYTADHLLITVNGVLALMHRVPLAAVGWFFRQYLCAAAVTDAGGEGLTFNQWGGFHFRFADIDGFDLSFDYLETF